MLYHIVLENGKWIWMNERNIREIHLNEDCSYTLFQFDGPNIIIKSFSLRLK